MHTLHLCVVLAESPQDACDATESIISDWGDENNWRTIVGCVSEKDQVYVAVRRHADWMEGMQTIADINHAVGNWMTAHLRPNGWLNAGTTLLRRVAKTPGRLSELEWFQLKQYCRHQGELAARRERRQATGTFNVLTEEWLRWKLDESGVTRLDADGEKGDQLLYVVFVDMHS